MSQLPDQSLRDFHLRWPSLKSPLRPPPEAVAAIAALLPDDPRPVLLLGVTPELAAIGRPLVGIDWSQRMASLAWPGNDANRKLIIADWHTMPVADGRFAAAIGDGSLSMDSFDCLGGLLQKVSGAVAKGGAGVFRCFAMPDPAEAVEAVVDEALAGALGFHAFKLRFNMAVGAANPDFSVRSASLFECFTRAFPDRAALAAASGWSLGEIAEIDAYRNSAYIHCYPPRAALATAATDAGFTCRFEPSGDYPGAEHCPLLVIDFA